MEPRFLDYLGAIDLRDQSPALELMEYFVGNFSGRSVMLGLLHTELFLGYDHSAWDMLLAPRFD